MPSSGLDYDKHGRIARVKPRTKEQDSRSINSSSTASRRHRDSSVSSNRTGIPQECALQRSESTSSSVNLEQLPGLPESESGSPSSASSSMVRTISNVSTSNAMISPSMYRTPAFLQAYLEPATDPAKKNEDPHATPKAEKSKKQCEPSMEPSKPEAVKAESIKPAQPPTDHILTANKKASSESTKSISIRSPSRTGAPPSTTNQASPSKEFHHTISQQTAPPSPTSGTPSHSIPGYPYGSGFGGPQAFQSPQLAYLSMPQIIEPSINQQALASQRLVYYPEYGPTPPPAPIPPPQSQQAPVPGNQLEYDEPMELLHRVDSVMPDLHRLLDSYHNIQQTVTSREHQIRSMDAQRAAEKQDEDKRYAKFEQQVQSMIGKHAAETNQFKLDINNMEKRFKTLQDKLTAEETHNDDLEAANENLRTENKQAGKKHEEEKAALLHRCSLEKDRMAADHRTKQRGLQDELQAQIRKTEISLSHKEASLTRAHEEEKQKIEMGWGKLKRELEERHDRFQMDLNHKLEAKVKVIDEERQTYLQAREGWDREREIMTRDWNEERRLLRKTWEEQHNAMLTKHEREKNEILKQMSQTQHRSDKDDTIFKLQKEIEALRTGWEADRFKFQRTTAEFKATARTLSEQHNKLQQLTEAFGETMEAREK